MDFSELVLLGALGCDLPAINALQYAATYVSRTQQGNLREIGYIRNNNKLILSKHSTTQLVSAMHFVVDASHTTAMQRPNSTLRSWSQTFRSNAGRLTFHTDAVATGHRSVPRA